MALRTGGLVGIVALGLVSCRSREASVYEPVSSPERAATASVEPRAEPRWAPPSPTAPEAGRKGEVPRLSFRPGTFDVKPPGTDGWSASRIDLRELGERMDAAMRGLREVEANVQTNFEVAGDQLTGRAVWRIRDLETFAVEYYSPRTKGSLNRLVGDGTNRAEHYRGTWREPTPPSGGPFTDRDTLEWPLDSMRHALGPFFGVEGCWSAILGAWAAGRGGYRATVELRKQKVRGEDRPVYRVVAKTAWGGETTVQLLIDGKRNLPGSFRFTRAAEGGQEDRLMWSIEWGFGGRHSAQHFVVPVDLSSQ